MKNIARLLVLVLATLGLTSITATAQASTVEGQAAGLIVRYEPGFDATAPNGDVTGANFVARPVVSARDLGQDFVAMQFDRIIPAVEAENYATKLRLDPRVQSVEVDHYFASPAASIQRTVKVANAIKPASAVQYLKAVDAWSSTQKTTARVRLTWTPPKYLYSAKLAGYRIERSVNKGAWVVVTPSLSPASRTITYSYPNEAGSSMRYRVSAITKIGTASRIGTASPIVTVVPTAAPRTPRLIGYVDNFVNEPMWLVQKAYERGGLPTTYVATATPLDSSPKLTCTTSVAAANSCIFANFTQGKEYKLAVSAKNSRGTSPAFTVVLPADPYFFQQWYLFGQYSINASKAWVTSKGSASTVVAVLDTGLAPHSEFAGKTLPGADFVSTNMGSNDGDGWDTDATDPGDYTSLIDNSMSSWHGTHVAGLVAAASNTEGVSGVAPNVKLLPVRIMGSAGGSQSDLVAGINWAAGFEVQGANPSINPNPAKVINISMGTPTATNCGTLASPTATLSAFQAAKEAGVTIVTSAGNGDANNHPIEAYLSYPGNCLGSINVGATGSEGKAASYSNYGLEVDISAPGGDNGIGCSLLDSTCKAQTAGTTEDAQGMILSTFNTGNKGPLADTYVFDEGTSMAAPLVSGVVALLYSAKPEITPDQVWTILRSTASAFRTGSQCALTVGNELEQRCGVGIVDADAALAYANSHY